MMNLLRHFEKNDTAFLSLLKKNKWCGGVHSGSRARGDSRSPFCLNGFKLEVHLLCWDVSDHPHKGAFVDTDARVRRNAGYTWIWTLCRSSLLTAEKINRSPPSFIFVVRGLFWEANYMSSLPTYLSSLSFVSLCWRKNSSLSSLLCMSESACSSVGCQRMTDKTCSALLGRGAVTLSATGDANERMPEVPVTAHLSLSVGIPNDWLGSAG